MRLPLLRPDIWLLSFFLVACGGDDDEETRAPAPSNGGTAGGTVGGAAAGAQLGGTTAAAGSAGGGTGGLHAGGTPAQGGGGTNVSAAGQAGSGGEPTGEELEDAAMEACDDYCALIHDACPAVDLGICLSTCYQQVETYAASGLCGDDHYRALRCIITTQSASTITCLSSTRWEYGGCKEEIAVYSLCVGG